MDLAVDAFEDAIGDVGVGEAEDALPVAFDGVGGIDDGFQTAVSRPEEPALKIVCGQVGGLFPEGFEAHADAVCTCCFQVELAQVFQPLALVLLQVFRVGQPEIAAASQECFVFLFFAPHPIDGIADDLHDMEAVEGDISVGKVGFHPLDEGGRQVAADIAHLVRIAVVGLEVLGEGGNGATVLAGGGKQDAELVQIDKQADVVVAPFACGLIHADAGYAAVVLLTACLRDIVAHHSPDAGVLLADQTGQRLDGKVANQCQDQRFEQQREPAARPCPGDLDLMNPAGRTFHPWHTRMQKCLVLKEIQVAPALLFGVVGRQTSYTALGADKVAADREINVQVKLAVGLGKGDLGDVPRRFQT